MPADVSNLVNMLATQPGQQIAGMGQQLLAAQEGVRKRQQQEFENQVITRKQQLEEAVTSQKMSMNEVEMAGKRGELIAQTAQGILNSQDPLLKQQILQSSAPVLLKAGVTEEQIQAGMQNIDNPQFWTSVQAMGVGANEYWKTTSSTAVNPSIAARKKAELIDSGVPREQAEGIAYGTYKFIPDPNTGNIVLRDLRNPGQTVPEDIEAVVSPHIPKSDSKRYAPKLEVRGTKVQRERNKAINELSDDMVKTGAPKVESSLELVESIIANTFEQGKDLPGMGATGRPVPDWAVSTQAQDLRQAAIKLFNIELAERSGAAVTKQELDRLRDEFKEGMWKTDRQFVKGVQEYRTLLEDYKKAALAGYPDDVKQQYWEQGGIALKEQKEKPSPKTIAPTEEQIRADAKKYGWSEEDTQNAIKQYVSQ